MPRDASPASKPLTIWISTTEAGLILDRPIRSVRQLGRDGVLMMNAPGRLRPKFKLSDVLGLARSLGYDMAEVEQKRRTAGYIS